MNEDWPTTWVSIRTTRNEYSRISDLLLEISEAAYDGKDYVLTNENAFWLAGLFHLYFAEGHFQGEKWKQRLLDDGHTVED